MSMKKKNLKSLGFSNYTACSTGMIYNNKLHRFMSTYTNNAGYTCVSLTNDDGVKCNRLVHLLIALVFVSNKDKLSDVNHKDNDKTNNAASNLEWISHSDNIKQMHADNK